MWDRIKLFFNIFDSRFEDLTRDNWKTTVYRDFSAGLIVAMTAIPMAMGFAIAMGLRPEQGIIAGAIACLVGRTFGGSKYQVYGPTAAFIPLIAALMAKYGEPGGGTSEAAHGFLVCVSILAGIVLMVMGLFGMGKLAKFVPNSIIVGFTVGIAIAIALTNIGEALGLQLSIKGGLISRVREISSHFGDVNWYAFLIAMATFFVTRYLLKVSIFIPAPLIALGLGTALSATVLSDSGIVLLKDRFGSIPTNFFVFTAPVMPELTSGVMVDIVYFVLAIVFVSAVESVLCSSMADRLANNKKTLFNPNKELWGQGLVQIITPLINGFPCTGALARTATSIKAGALTPLAGYFKGVIKLTLAYFLASYLDLVPMACIAGILLWVASNMIKPAEIREVLRANRFHAALMIYTAVMVPVTDFLTGVLSALVIYGVGAPIFDREPSLVPEGIEAQPELAAEPQEAA
jgi:MFS superfamily sulfate permease-like transporter